MVPVVGRKIGAPDLDALRGEIVLDGFGARQTGDTCLARSIDIRFMLDG